MSRDREGEALGAAGAGRGKGCCACRVWLYVDDQLQQMKRHQGLPPRPQAPSEKNQVLYLGGWSESGNYSNFSGCISNVFMLR